MGLWTATLKSLSLGSWDSQGHMYLDWCSSALKRELVRPRWPVTWLLGCDCPGTYSERDSEMQLVSVEVRRFIRDVCHRHGVRNYILHISDFYLRNEGTSFGPSWLKKVQLYRLKGGEEISNQPVDSPSAEWSAKWKEEEAAILKEKATVWKQGGSLHLHTHKPRAPSHSQAPGQQVWQTLTLHISP